MTDQEILRELASAYMEAANEPVNAERRERAYATNELQAVRPLVWIHELPWHELNIDDALTLRCEGALAREIAQSAAMEVLSGGHDSGAVLSREHVYPLDRHRVSGD